MSGVTGPAARPGDDGHRAARRLGHGDHHGHQASKTDPRDIARQAADAIASGALEVLADETTRTVKSQLSDVTCRRTLHLFNRPVKPAEVIGKFLTER
jgi:hypothetical protein